MREIDLARDLLFALCALLAFLLPVGFYCLILAAVNRRGKPLLVGGAWDSIGLLFSLSGFFLATFPMLLSEFFSRVLQVAIWNWLLWGVYFLFLISGMALMLVWRAHKTIVYNVDPELFSKALEHTFANVGLSMGKKGERLLLTPLPIMESAPSTALTEEAPMPAPVVEDSRYAEMVVESFPSMCNVTLHWDNYAPEVRRQIEAELDRCLEGAAPLENSSAGWFLNISGMIFGTLFMVVATFVILVMLAKH